MGAMLVRHEPSSAAAVRRELAADLGAHGVPADAVDNIVLVAAELLTNAVQHGGISPLDELDISWSVAPTTVLVSVDDANRDVPVRGEAARCATSGRGMFIVEALAREWGVQRTGRGKRVWARIGYSAA